MEHREPPGIGSTEDAPPRRFPRLLAPPTVRRPAPGRLLLAGGGLVGVLALVALGVAQVRSYVNGRHGYQVSYREVVLEPTPPEWFRGGSGAFLDHALGGAGEFREFSALDFDRDKLLLLFRRYAWVERVLRVEVGYPNRVVVRLEYREPVAVEKLADESDRTVIDHDGVILPRDDIDFDRVGPLVRLYGFTPPADPKAGLPWDRNEPNQGLTVRDDRVRDAARLAAFLHNELRRQGADTRAPRFVAIFAWGLDGTSVQVGTNLVVWWDEPGSGDVAGRLSDEAKWGLTLDRVRDLPTQQGAPRIDLRFTKDGIKVHEATGQADRPGPPETSPGAKRTRTSSRDRDRSGN